VKLSILSQVGAVEVETHGESLALVVLVDTGQQRALPFQVA
jgi:hypothetical protein